MHLSKQQLKTLHDFAIEEFRLNRPDPISPDTFTAECWVRALERMLAKEFKIIIIKEKDDV